MSQLRIAPGHRSPRNARIQVIGVIAVFGTAIFAACGGGGYTGTKGITGPPPTAIRAAKWGLEWADEFNGPSIDAANWNVADFAANVNNELEYYTPSDVYIENGNLVLRSQQRPMGGRNYTSGEVLSGTKHVVRRGAAVEWRTKVPSGKGIWPANWLVSSKCTGAAGCGGDWPPEIDVMEMRGSVPTQNVMTHWWGTYPAQQHQTSIYASATDLSADYHTYRVEWFTDSVVWYVDGVQRAKHTDNITIGQLQLVMNTAVGGDFDGSPDASTVFPAYQRIDYVRVYRDTANTY